MDSKGSAKSKYSWWGRRSKIEKCSFAIIALFAVAIIFLMASNLSMKFPSSQSLQQDICMSDKCIRSAASILEKLDKTVDPCEDFYKFACGNYIKNTIIPDEKIAISSSFSVVSDKVNNELREVFEEPIHDSDLKPLRHLKTIYKSCMNVTKIENEGLGYIKRAFKDLGGWPLLEGNYWNDNAFDWKKLLYRVKAIGWRRNFFFTMYIGQDLKNSSIRILTITQPCLAYDRLKKGLNDTANQAAYNYLVEIATIFGADRLYAAAEMKEVIDFEISLAKIIIPYDQRKNSTAEYNPMTIKELQRNFTFIPWLRYINEYLSPIDMLTSEDVVSVSLPKFLNDLENLLQKTKKRVLSNYMFSRLVRDSVTYLPQVFRNKELEYLKIVYGKSEVTPRWKDCVWEAANLHIAVSSLYVKKFFNRSTKNKISELVLDIKGSFLETLRKIGWMDRKTKKHAIAKAEKMDSFIAYPNELLDDYKIEDYYEGLELNPDDYYLKTSFNTSLFYHMKHIQDLREPVIKNDWGSQSYSYIVNAFYDQTANAIELPAAILQESFFDYERPQYMNYGRIGEIIGHEITHGFDDRGRQYDKDGNLIDWWEPETNRTFARKSQCLVEQYGNYSIPEIGMNLNGVKNLGENIADNGGIKIAYRGYLKWMERNDAEVMLPGLPYTPRQMFWISTATNWCTKYRKEALKQFVTSGHHAPSYFRVIVPFMNSDYFGRDFNCPLGSSMNPKYKCRIW